MSNTIEKSVNRVIYNKNDDNEHQVVTSNFVIINNNKITCDINISEGKLGPTIILRNNDKIMGYVNGIQQVIPDLIRFSSVPNQILVDLISEKFNILDINPSIIDNLHNIVQYDIQDNPNNSFYQFQRNPVKYETLQIDGIKPSIISYEERLYLNFKKGFLFSIINKKFKLLYIYIENQKDKVCSDKFIKLADLCNKIDLGAISRIIKFWPELNVSAVMTKMDLYLVSDKIGPMLENSDFKNGDIFYIFNNHGSNEYKISIPFSSI
jgi:hypothetical protein